MFNKFLSIFSQAAHYVVFSCKKPLTTFDKGLLILSIDIDVGCQELGEKNKMNYHVHDYLQENAIGRIEEQAVPLLLQSFNDLEVPVTFALRGQLTELDNSIINLILRSPVKHDIGAHGYYHRIFTELSKVKAEKELEMISKGMKKFGVKPRSFVFPRNKVAHLPLLEKWEYSCFRGGENLLRDGMYVKKYGNLYDIHSGLYLGRCDNLLFLKKIINIAAKYNAPLHVWFHPWNLGDSLEAINKRMTRVIMPFLQYAKEKQKYGALQFETMRSMAEKAESIKIGEHSI